MDPKARDILDLLARDGPQLHALLTRLTLRQDAAEELMQDLFLNLHRTPGYSAASNRAAYAYRAAVHLAFDWRRRQRRDRQIEPLTVEPAHAPRPALEGLIDAEQIERILNAANRLPETMRYALVMHWLQDRPYEAIAAELGKTTHQVRGLCHKALSQIRRQLAGESAGPRRREDCHVES